MIETKIISNYSNVATSKSSNVEFQIMWNKKGILVRSDFSPRPKYTHPNFSSESTIITALEIRGWRPRQPTGQRNVQKSGCN